MSTVKEKKANDGDQTTPKKSRASGAFHKKPTNIFVQQLSSSPSTSPKSPLHQRRSSEPADALKGAGAFPLLQPRKSYETEDYHQWLHFVQQHCPKLLVDCSCNACAQEKEKKTSPVLSPPATFAHFTGAHGAFINLPLSSLEHAHSTPVTNDDHFPTALPALINRQSSKMADDCEHTKNLALLQVIGMGVQTRMPRLLALLNDVNNRLLYQQYLRKPDFYTISNAEHDRKDASVEESDDEDQDARLKDVEVLLPPLTDVISPEPMRYSRSSSVLDSVPLIHAKKYRHASWNIPSLHQAIRAYHSRLVPPLNFAPRVLIKDNIQQYLSLISLSTIALSKLKSVTMPKAVMPFQFDVVILSADTSNQSQVPDAVKPAPYIEACTAEQASICNNQHHRNDEIGNIMQRLKSLPIKCHHKHQFFESSIEVPNLSHMQDPALILRRFQQKLDHVPSFKQNMQHGRYVCIIDRNGARTNPVFKSDTDLHGAARTRAPKANNTPNPPKLLRRRTTTKILRAAPSKQVVPKLVECKVCNKEIADQGSSLLRHLDTHIGKECKQCLQPFARYNNVAARSKNDQNDDDEKASCRAVHVWLAQEFQTNKPDYFYFYQPPKPYGDLIEGVAMDEAMHMNTLDYLLPPLETESCPIGARHLCGGNMFTMSFHFMRKDRVKCYLYLDQKCMSINLKKNHAMTDLMRILPHYFDDPSFRVLDIKRALKESLTEKKGDPDDTAVHQFEQCVKKLFAQWDDEAIERDLCQNDWQQKSKICQVLQKQHKWDWKRIDRMHRCLSGLFCFVPVSQENTQDSTNRALRLDSPQTLQVPFISTIDREYNEVEGKLKWKRGQLKKK